MVGMLDSLSLKNTKLGLETLDLMGYDTEHVSLVLNRADSRVGITPDDVIDDHRSCAGRLRPERPRDPALDQRGDSDRRVEAERPARRRRSGLSPTATRRRRAPTPAPLPSSASGVRALIGRRR